MTSVRLGIIGLGNIGRYHAEYLLAGKVQDCQLTAVADANPTALDEHKSLATFERGEDLIQSGQVDAVIIATPHFQHTPLAMLALRSGVHVMVEKPISAHKADALRLIEAHREHPEIIFGAMLQLRLEPRYVKIRQLIQSGQIGQLMRINWINTDWYRTDAYYASSAWRATWKGEGGGVLLNQCLHNLDILQHLCGMPQRLRGFCQLGRFHSIEVEDNVTACMEWANGATGVFISSTGEAPGTNRLEIVGTLGTLVLEHGRLELNRNEQDMVVFARTAEKGFAKPQAAKSEIAFEDAVMPHAALVQNFVDTILGKAALISPGEDGIQSLELANAMVYSSLLGQTLELPMDAGAWEAKLNELIAGSTMKKTVVKISADDLAGSFRK